MNSLSQANEFREPKIEHLQITHSELADKPSSFLPSLLNMQLRQCLQNYILFPFLKHYCRDFKVIGLHNLEPLQGPCLFVSNHASHADTAIILCALPPRHKSMLAVAAAADYFYKNKLIAALVTLVLNTFPFERSHPRRGFLRGKQVLQSGQSLLIFPEGTRAKPSDHLSFKRGFAALACNLGLPVVPICIEGSYNMLPKGAKWPRQASVQIIFGQAIYPAGQSSTELAQLAENRVHGLSPAA